MRSQLGQNLKDSVDDPVIDEVIARGTARQDMTPNAVGDDSGREVTDSSSLAFPGAQKTGDGLLRDIASGNSGISHAKSSPPPIHPAQAKRGADSGSPGGAIGGLSNDEAQPVRKPS